jgi:hypothetical protein
VSPAEVLRRFVAAIEGAGLPYMLTGSHASSLHGIPRSSFDLDFVCAPSRDDVRRLVVQLKEAGCYVDERAALEALDAYGQFNAIHIESGWKADFIIRKPRPFSQVEFERRRGGVLYGVPIIVATAEDVLIAKLEWAKLGESSRQIEDAGNILKARSGNLDHEYVADWIKRLELEDQWQAAVRFAGRAI